MGEEDSYISETELSDVETLDGDELVRVIDTANDTPFSGNTEIGVLCNYIFNSYSISELNDFSTLSDPTGVEKTATEAINSLLGHFQIRTLTGTTNASGIIGNDVHLSKNEIFLGGVATCGTTECRAYAYTPSGSGDLQYIQVTNRLAAVVKNKSVTVKALIFKIDLSIT